MNVLAIVGSPRKGKSTDTLVDKAIEGVNSKDPNGNVKKINLIEHDIKFCKNCLTCRDVKTNEPVTKCVIRDDMDHIKEIIKYSYVDRHYVGSVIFRVRRREDVIMWMKVYANII